MYIISESGYTTSRWDNGEKTEGIILPFNQYDVELDALFAGGMRIRNR